MCFGALGVFWRAWGVLARLVCFGALGVFGALSLVYPSRLKFPITPPGPLLSQAPIPVPVCMLSQCGFGVCFILLFFPLALFYCCPFCFRCFLLFCWWNLQLGRKTCYTIFIFSHQESYVCELNLTITVNYGFLSFWFWYNRYWSWPF